MNSKIVSEPTGEQMTLFSPVGSLNHANPTPSQESGSEKRMIATSGRKCLDAFGRLSRAGSWAKTFSELLIGTGDWYSTRCNLTWKLKGTKYKRLFFQLAPSTPRTGGIGSGLLLTPTTIDIQPNEERYKKRTEYRESIGRKWVPGSLTEQVEMMGLLPTPRATKISGTDREDFSPSLPGLMNKGLLPTPTTNDGKNTTLPPSQAERNGLPGAIMKFLPTPNSRDEKGASGLTNQYDLNRELGIIGLQLNPQFVGEMMGFPPDWTELPFLNGETNPLKRTEMP